MLIRYDLTKSKDDLDDIILYYLDKVEDSTAETLSFVYYFILTYGGLKLLENISFYFYGNK